MLNKVDLLALGEFVEPYLDLADFEIFPQPLDSDYSHGTDNLWDFAEFDSFVVNFALNLAGSSDPRVDGNIAGCKRRLVEGRLEDCFQIYDIRCLTFR